MSDNPLLDDIGRMPGVAVSLPTGGAYYDKTVLAQNADPMKLYVRPVTVLDEIAFRNPHKVLAGVAVSDMIRRACPDVLRPDALLTIDANAVILAARIASNGPTAEVTVTCNNPEVVTVVMPNGDSVERPKCRHTEDLVVNLQAALAEFKPLIDSSRPDRWVVKMPSGQAAAVAPMPLTDSHKIIRAMAEESRDRAGLQAAVARQKEASAAGDMASADEADKMADLYQARIADRAAEVQVIALTASVPWVTTASGVRVTDRRAISEWIASLPIEWMTTLIERSAELAAEISEYGVVQHTCRECSHVQKVSLNSDPTAFFSGGSRRRPAPKRS